MISKVPLSQRDAQGEKRGMFIRSMKKPMDTPLAEGNPMGKSLRQPAEDFVLNKSNRL